MNNNDFFIAYEGIVKNYKTELKKKDIYNVLKEKCPKDCKVKINRRKDMLGPNGRDIIFAEIIHPQNKEKFRSSFGTLNPEFSVKIYNPDELISACKAFYPHSNVGTYLFDKLYEHDDIPPRDGEDIHQYMYRFRKYNDTQRQMFKKLKQYMSFCCVLYRIGRGMTAAVAEPSNPLMHLYYGYTRKNHDIILSNNKDLLTNFCDYIYEMKKNTYMFNKKLYNFYGREIGCISNPYKKDEYVNNEKGNSKTEYIPDDQLLKAINELKEEDLDSPEKNIINDSDMNQIQINSTTQSDIKQTTNDVKREESTSKNVFNKELNSELIDDDSSPKITETIDNANEINDDFLLDSIEKNGINQEEYDKPQIIKESSQLNNKIQKLKSIRDELKNMNLEDKESNKNNDIIDTKLVTDNNDSAISNIIIKKNDIDNSIKDNGALHHETFSQILSQIQLDEPIMLIGPAGSGKNVAVSQVADELGLHMYYTNNASNEFKLTGFIDAGGTYRETEFYKAFKNGGIFFLDEIDTSDPAALIVINSALANGYMAFPHETIDRHKNFRIIAAANTWGKGADLQYVGRNVLDGATLDRFDNIFFDYDIKLEKALYPNKDVLLFMWEFRNAVYKSRIQHIVSTRSIGKVYKKEINGIPVENILTSNIIKNLSQDDVNTIIGHMRNLTSDNKYYDGIKKLRLGR